MSNEIVFGIKFTADGKQFVGEAKIAREELDKLGKSTGSASQEASKLNRETSNLASSFGSLSSVVKTVAASYAVLKVAQYAQEAALLSARYETLGVSMRVVGNNAGYTSAEMEAAAVGMQKTGISMVESRQQALRLVQANIDLAQSSKLARIAQDAAVIGNMNSSEAFAKMIHGIQTGQTDVLRYIGLNISMEQSHAAYAKTLGKSADALTQTEKTQAVLNAVMKEGEAIAGTYEAAMGTAGKQLNSMKRYTEDLQLKFGEVFNESLVVGVMALTDGLKDANGQITELSQKNQLKKWGEDLTDVFAALADNVGNAVGALKLLSLLTGGAIAKAASPFMGSGAKAALEVAAYGKSVSEDVSAQYAAIMDGEDKYTKALAARRAARSADDAAQRAQVAAFAEYEKQVMLTGAATTAKEKNTILMAAAKGMGVEYANQFAGADATAAKAAGGANERAKAIEAEAKSYARLTESTTAHIAVLGAEANATAKLPKAYQDLIGYLANYKKGLTAENEAKQQATIATLAQAAGMEIAAAASDAAGKAAEKQADAETKRLDALDKSVATDQKALDALTRKNDLLELGIVSVEQMALAELNLQAAMLDSATVTAAEVIALQQRIDIAQQMIDQANRGEHIKAVQGEAEQADKAWRKTCESINDGLTDAIWRGFESGKGFGKNFIDTVENMFNTLVLRPIISAVMSPVSGAITAGMGAMGFPGAANAAGTGSDLLGLASMGSSIASFGSSVATGFSLSATAATTAAEAYSLAGMGATSFGLQLGNMAAAIPGWGWAIAGGLALAGLLSGNGGTPTASTGHAVIDYDAAGKQTGYQSLYGVQNAATDATAAGMNASYLDIADSLGIGTVATQFAYAGNTGKNGEQPMFGLHGGAVGGPQFVQGETVYSDEAMGEAASRAVFAALQGSELPGYLAGVFNGLDASKMSGQDISNTLAFAASLKSVRTGLTETVTPISAAQDALDEIGSTAATFTTDFVAAIDAGMTPEKLAQWLAAGAALGSLGDMSLTMSAAVPQLTQTTWEMWNTQTTSVRGLISTFDGSVAATHALSAATKERYATEQQLVDQISVSMGGLSTMFAGSAEQMRLSVMSAQEKSNYFVDQANALEAQIMSATDPARVEQLAREYNDAANNAWANLDDTQRQSNLEQYTRNLDEINAITQEKLGKTLDEITATSGTELPDLIARAVGDAMDAFLLAQQTVANAMQDAADTMQGAADTPVQVAVAVDFTADVPGSSQVAVLP